MDITISASNADSGGLTKRPAQVGSVEAHYERVVSAGVLLAAHAYFVKSDSDKFTHFTIFIAVQFGILSFAKSCASRHCRCFLNEGNQVDANLAAWLRPSSFSS